MSKEELQNELEIFNFRIMHAIDYFKMYKNMNRISVILTETSYGKCNDYIDDFKCILDSI